MHAIRTLALAAALAVTALTTVVSPAAARGLIRDADIEYALEELAAPVLAAAGLNPSSVRIMLVNDDTMNAFVADHRHIFIHSGLVLKLENARSLQAVIAHEAAHITNGHITRRIGNMRAARGAAGLGLALAAAAALSGAPGDAAAGIAAGTAGSAIRRMLAHTRAEEASADLSSLRYLVAAGIDPRGALEVQEIFRGQELISAGRQDPYMRSHPLTRDRMRATEAFVAGLARDMPARPADEYWFARAQGKLAAFTRNPSRELRRADRAPTPDLQAMVRAVSLHRLADAGGALREIDRAIAMRPSDPFLVELKGQILLESRRFAEAARVYGRAAEMAPSEPLVLAGLGRAQLAAGQVSAALATLERASGRDGTNPALLRDLAQAYARLGRNGMASLATAERYALQGRLKDARINAERAEGLLPEGSVAWQRAQDVLSATRDL